MDLENVKKLLATCILPKVKLQNYNEVNTERFLRK